MIITAHVRNHSVALPADLNIAEGAEVQITLPSVEPSSPQAPVGLNWMMKYAGAVDGPEDFAREHNHYAHGVAKNNV